MFSQGVSEGFRVGRNDDRLVLIKSSGGQRHTVFILLRKVPIMQTVQLQWDLYVQPKQSYGVRSNLVVFSWGDDPAKLSTKDLVVSYVPDPSDQTTYKSIAVKEQKLYLDGKAVQGNLSFNTVPYEQ